MHKHILVIAFIYTSIVTGMYKTPITHYTLDECAWRSILENELKDSCFENYFWRARAERTPFPIAIHGLEHHEQERLFRHLLFKGSELGILFLLQCNKKLIHSNIFCVHTRIFCGDNIGMTPLHYATRWCTPHIVRILLDHGAHVNAPDSRGNTPLHYATYCCNHLMIALLRAYGADLKAPNNEGITPLQCAQLPPVSRSHYLQDTLPPELMFIGAKRFFHPIHEWDVTDLARVYKFWAISYTELIIKLSPWSWN